MITTINNKNYHLDIPGNRITFLDSRFYLSDTGAYYPSSTTILSCYPKGTGFYEWLKRVGEDADEIRDEAGDRGSKVHKLTELYDEGHEVSLFDEQGNINYKMIEWSMFERFVNFRERFPAEVLHTEMHVVSDKLGFGGTLDRIMNIDGKRVLVDIKTGNAIYPHFWLQLASYVKLYEDNGHEPIDEIAVLHLQAKTKTDGKKGSCQGVGWQLIYPEKSIDHYFSLFKSVHQLWLSENSEMQPKQFSYQLNHIKK